MTGAEIYKRLNGEFGASCDGCADTGHCIVRHPGDWFTVHSIHDPDVIIADYVSRAAAERAIAEDWRRK